MGKDIRLAVGFFDHPKTIKLKRKLGLEGIESLIRLWMYAAVNKTKGILSDMTEEDICIACKWERPVDDLLNALSTLRWLEFNAPLKSYVIHDWENHQGWVFYSEERIKYAQIAGKASARKRKKIKESERGVDGAFNPKGSTPSPSPIPLKDCSSVTKKTTKTKKTDLQIMEELKTNPAYKGIDIDREWNKMQAWCSTKGKLPTMRRFVNWLNNVERPVLSLPSRSLTEVMMEKVQNDIKREKEKQNDTLIK